MRYQKTLTPTETMRVSVNNVGLFRFLSSSFEWDLYMDLQECLCTWGVYMFVCVCAVFGNDTTTIKAVAVSQWPDCVSSLLGWAVGGNPSKVGHPPSSLAFHVHWASRNRATHHYQAKGETGEDGSATLNACDTQVHWNSGKPIPGRPCEFRS